MSNCDGGNVKQWRRVREDMFYVNMRAQTSAPTPSPSLGLEPGVMHSRFCPI